MKALVIFSNEDCKLKIVDTFEDAVIEIKNDLISMGSTIAEDLVNEDFLLEATTNKASVADILGNTVNYKIFNLSFENPPTLDEILALR